MEQDKNSNGNLIVYLLFVVIALIWGLSFVVIKITLEDYSPVENLALRWGISGILFIILKELKILKISFKGKPVGSLILMCAFQPGIYSIFEAMGVEYATPSESSIIIGLIPLAVAVESAIIFKNKPTRKSVIGVIIGFTGLVFCIAFSDSFAAGSSIKGYIFLIVAMFSGSSYVLLCNKNSKFFSTSEITCMMAVVGGIEYNIMSLLAGNGLRPYRVFLQGGLSTWAILFLAIGCGMIAYAINNYNISKLPPVVASCIQQNSINFVGVVAGIIISGDPWGWYTIVGLIMISVGIVLTALKEND